MTCSAYCTAASYNIPELYRSLAPHYKCTKYREVLHVVYPSENSEHTDVFYFPYGATVAWSRGSLGELSFLEAVKPFQRDPNEVAEEENYKFVFGKDLKVENNFIILPNTDLLTQLAVSYGLAQSVKLGAFEYTLGKTFEHTRHIPENLAKEGKIPLSRKQIRQEMGQLFLKRSSINLHVDVLDTPEFFWDHPHLEPIYIATAKELDIETRTEVLNHRLDVIRELFEVLGNELNHQHSSRLEWIIIWLIVSEVLVSLLRDVLKII